MWKASLYLCDYIIYNSGVIFNKDSKVVEFGAGVGLTSLICSLFIDKVMCTDLENVIKLAENNYNLNKNILNNEILFKKIDWKNYSKIFDDEEEADELDEDAECLLLLLFGVLYSLLNCST